MRILVAEYDLALSSFLEREFVAQKYSVDLAADADGAKHLARQREYDAAVLDLNLPRQAGFDFLHDVRSVHDQLPILMLTSRTCPEDRAQLLDLGADDLVLKPFALSELSARLRALLRRGGHRTDSVLRVDDLELSRVQHSVTRSGRRIELTQKEFALLEYLMLSAGQRVTRMQIVENVWHLSFDTMTNIVDVYINYLRRKVDASSERKLIHTVRGVGYRLQSQRVAQANAR
jgi:two-component system, OmpR family, copper resistance phosphate regulon response regulator CusR